MSAPECDIAICGGGVAGLSAAIAFGAAGFRVTCVDPAPPVTTADAPGSDLRSTAIMQPAQRLLAQAGLWDRLAPHAAPLQVMRIVDAGGPDGAPRSDKRFDASDISDAPFGWNLPNWLLRREMMTRINALETVDFRPGIAATGVFTRSADARVLLSDGGRLRTRLVIAADGRDSLIRREAGIQVDTTRYGQKAIAFAVTHPHPHGNVSTEVHRAGGPFTLVPLPDLNGLPCSAVVWMERGPRAVELAAMDVADFEAEMLNRSAGLYGPLTLASRRSVWPIISQIAARMSGQRVALMAEAAHVVPPIGAQGLNMSLGDLRALLDLARARPEGLGDRAMLDAYHKARAAEVRARVTGIDLLNRASMAGQQILKDARFGGLSLLYGVAPVRKRLMRLGLGVS